MITVTYRRNGRALVLHYAMPLKEWMMRNYLNPEDYPFLVTEIVKVEVR